MGKALRTSFERYVASKKYSPEQVKALEAMATSEKKALAANPGVQNAIQRGRAISISHDCAIYIFKPLAHDPEMDKVKAASNGRLPDYILSDSLPKNNRVDMCWIIYPNGFIERLERDNKSSEEIPSLVASPEQLMFNKKLLN